MQSGDEGKRLVIAGGGPTGLFTACRAADALDRREWSIVVIERRPEYVREQRIILYWLSAVKHMLPERVRQELLGADAAGCYVSPFRRLQWLCFTKEDTYASVSIEALERALLDYARDRGVEVLRPAHGQPAHTLSFDTAANTVFVDGVPIGYDVLVGADGANSHVRREVLGADMVPFFPDTPLFLARRSARAPRRPRTATPEDLGGVFPDDIAAEHYVATHPHGGDSGTLAVLHADPIRPLDALPYGD